MYQYILGEKWDTLAMSLTLARLCGDWQLVSGNYEARGASGGKYEDQIVIFCILGAVNRFSRISRKTENRWRKSESRWRKLESHWRKEKAVEENQKAVEENWILCEENRSLGEGKSWFSQEIL
jgi:hypothetical protein